MANTGKGLDFYQDVFETNEIHSEVNLENSAFVLHWQPDLALERDLSDLKFDGEGFSVYRF